MRKGNKRYSGCGEKTKLFSCTDDTIVDVGNLEESTKQLQEISKYGKVAGYEVKYKSQKLSYIPVMNKWNLKLKARYHLH